MCPFRRHASSGFTLAAATLSVPQLVITRTLRDLDPARYTTAAQSDYEKRGVNPGMDLLIRTEPGLIRSAQLAQAVN